MSSYRRVPFLIDEIVGDKIRKANKAKAYGEIENFLRYDARLDTHFDTDCSDKQWEHTAGGPLLIKMLYGKRE